LPLESSNTLNGSWGFNIGDNAYKSPEEVEEMLVRAAGYNFNLLLNIGPMAQRRNPGRIRHPPSCVGEWISRYGTSIYGTRGGPLAPADWGVTTQKGDTIYVHVLHWNAPLLALAPIQRIIASAHELTSNSAVEFTQNSSGVVLKLPALAKAKWTA